MTLRNWRRPASTLCYSPFSGFVWTSKAETTYGGHLLPNDVVFEDYGEAPPRLLEFAAEQSQVLRCPICRAVIVEDEHGIHF
jgi:hypothetical protein